MAIPDGMLSAKLLVPTVEPSPIRTLDVAFDGKRPASVFEAITVAAMVVAFIGLIALLPAMARRRRNPGPRWRPWGCVWCWPAGRRT